MKVEIPDDDVLGWAGLEFTVKNSRFARMVMACRSALEQTLPLEDS